jgi:hypothetical protein
MVVSEDGAKDVVVGFSLASGFGAPTSASLILVQGEGVDGSLSSSLRLGGMLTRVLWNCARSHGTARTSGERATYVSAVEMLNARRS